MGKPELPAPAWNIPAHSYGEMKEAIQDRFHINPDASWQKHHDMSWNRVIEPEDMVAREMKLATRWLEPDKGTKQMIEKIVLEHLVSILPHDMRVWVSDHQPARPKEVAELIQTYGIGRRKPEGRYSKLTSTSAPPRERIVDSPRDAMQPRA